MNKAKNSSKNKNKAIKTYKQAKNKTKQQQNATPTNKKKNKPNK